MCKEKFLELRTNKTKLTSIGLRNLFISDPNRADKFSLTAGDLLIDYSKNFIDTNSLKQLLQLIDKPNFFNKITGYFTGKPINTTEKRAVLHTALRKNDLTKNLIVGQENITTLVNNMLIKLMNFTEKILSHAWLGYSGKPIDTVVNIGIGGSDLGPQMVSEALRRYRVKKINSFFISNLDPSNLTAILDQINPETTIFVIVSKTFLTIETLTNATLAKKWFLAKTQAPESAIAKHFVAVSTNSAKVTEFGIDINNRFEFWDWVGGRYSITSAAGLTVMLQIGGKNFQNFLAGFNKIDKHFRNTDIEANAPIILALLQFWYNNFFNCQSKAILPYAYDLRSFPAYLQQLIMESNGKSVTTSGKPLKYQSSEIIWGAAGTNGQHAFYQMLHQGTHLVPCDFIGFSKNSEDIKVDSHTSMQQMLFSNLIAQSQILAFGKTAEELAQNNTPPELIPHKIMAGNKPNNVILTKELTPHTLGQLIALYEHYVFVAGAILDINSYDQWGVELGKQQATKLKPQLSEKTPPDSNLDSSTYQLINWYKNQT